MESRKLDWKAKPQVSFLPNKTTVSSEVQSGNQQKTGFVLILLNKVGGKKEPGRDEELFKLLGLISTEADRIVTDS